MAALSLNARWPRQLLALPWGVVLAVVALGGFGLVVLYSAAGGSPTPWALNQGIRFAALLGMMVAVAQVRPGFWLAHAYTIYAVVLAGLVGVEVMGQVSGGAQRWLDLGLIRLQPSEFMKLAIILGVARFYHNLPRGFVRRWGLLWPPLALIGAPALLVVLQPDLGTALMILGGGVVVMFASGVPMRLFVGGAVAVAAALPLVYAGLHDYQRRRVDIFLDPSSDPLGAGYHITQSKIAIGSGGWTGKGWLQGTQSHLDYLPERHTDFVFATLFEEWGLAGGLTVLALYAVLIGWAMTVALGAATHFARLTALGLASTLFFYAAINLLMVMGLAPVVGIPLPLVSFGGSAMLTVLLTLGVLMGIARERSRALPGVAA